jgi:hypothetical protein
MCLGFLRPNILVFVLSLTFTPGACAQSKFYVLHNFGATGDGAGPFGPPLVVGRKLYGVTDAGGITDGMCPDYGCGMVYELTQAGGKVVEYAVHDFNNDGDGYGPEGNLIRDSFGNLYGTEPLSNLPGVFELESVSGGWNFSWVYDQPETIIAPGIVMDSSGNLYGVIGNGVNDDGAMGELSPGVNGWTYTLLYSFCSLRNCPDGYYPYNPVSMDTKGNLYGTTFHGGIGGGVAYQLARNTDLATGAVTWTYHLMHTFRGLPDGADPNGGLTLDSLGNAYGTTPIGGGGCPSPGCGTVFKLSPNPAVAGWTETILYDFPNDSNCVNGCAPAFQLVFDKAGNLYGLNGGGKTCPGGAPCGMVYKLTPTKSGPWTYSIVHEFDGTDGEYPRGLTIDDDGNLYGVTTMGGLYNNGGVVFMITP